MLIHADVKGLEVVGAAFLSQDPVLCQEIRDGVDIHAVNQERFGLPDRLTSKKFKFRLIYGGQAPTYARDPDFTHVSRKVEFWEDVIAEYYRKYKGLGGWHRKLVDTVVRQGQLIMPTGRVYTFDRAEVIRNTQFWRPKILNYPVQGLGADLVAIARVSLRKRMIKEGLDRALLCGTVHDSIDIDVPEEMCYNVCKLIKTVVADVPINFERLFGVRFNLPLSAEVAYGPNLEDLQEYK